MADSDSPRLARSAGVFGVATITSRILGLAREQVMAYYFGAGDANDAFRVASRIPNLVRDLFAEGAMSAAFIPTFTRTLTLKGKEQSWHLANSVINALLLVTGVIVIVGIVFAEPLVRFYAPSFALVPGKIELTILLARIAFPFLTLVAIAAVMMGMLNSLGHFFVPALSPAMFNVSGIVMALTLIPLAPRLGVRPITIIAIATLVGGLGQLAIQFPALRKEGYRYRPTLDFKDEALHRALLLMGPGTLGMAATQINVFVNTYLATSQGTGAVSWLDFAFRLMYLPIGLFGVSVATAATPAISRMVAEQNFERIRSTLASALGLMLFLNVPATVGLMVLARPIISVIFEHGHFTSSDTLNTAAALQFYSIGLIGYSIVRIVSPTFYALGRSRIPVMVSAGSVLLNIGLNITLVRVMGYRGLALGTSVTALLNALVQMFLLRREIHGIGGSRIAASFVRVVVASVAMGAVTWLVQDLMISLMPGASLPERIIRLLVTIAASLATLAGVAQVLKIPEFGEARDMIIGRFRRLAR
ncbi:MAG: murein biosynthesis integral membrane protein MurJ [Acidobacteriota bacterium]